MEPIAFLFLALGAIVFAMGTYLVANAPSVAAVLVLAVFLLETVTRNSFGTTVGPLSIYLADGLFLLLLGAVSIRLVSGHIRLTKGRIYAAILMALFTFSIGRGFIINGSQIAGVEARPIFYFLAGLIYFGSFDLRLEKFEKLMELVVGAATLLCAIVAWKVAINGLGTSTGQYVNGSYIDGRALPASAALLVGQAMLLVFFFPKLVPFFGRWPLLPTLLLSTVVILQHRTVWAAMLATITIGILSRTAGRRRLLVMLLGVIVVAPITGILLLGENLTPARKSLEASAISAFESEGTFVWRFEGWASLLQDPANTSTASLAMGRPFGSGYDRRVNGVLVTYSPHNFYLNTLLRLGMPGLVLVLLLYLQFFSPKEIVEIKDREVLALVRLLALAQLAYFVSYTPFYDQGLIVGSMIGLLATTALVNRADNEAASRYVSSTTPA